MAQKDKSGNSILIGGGVVAVIAVVILAVVYFVGLPGEKEVVEVVPEPPKEEPLDIGETPELAIIQSALEPFTGDWEAMLERGFVRVLTVYNPINMTYDGVEQAGVVVDIVREMEKYLRKVGDKRAGTLDIGIIPVSRRNIIPYLREGRGDIAVANLTVTPGRSELVTFSDPLLPDVSEIVVTGPAVPDVTSLDDLVEQGIHVRESGSYFEHLTALNAEREKAGKEPVPIHRADEFLEDYGLLEMVNAGLLPAVIVDDWKAKIWADVHKKLAVHEDIVINEGGQIAWAMRKENTAFHEVINKFAKTVKKGTAFGNTILRRYLKDRKWLENVAEDDAFRRYQSVVELIRKYAEQYDVDWRMITAQGYQESKLDQKARSRAGGVMQIKPSTAADPNVGIKDVTKAEPNIHAGIKYLDFLRKRYFSGDEIPPLDKILISLAAYNAGPGNMRKSRKRAEKMGLDPNRWFGELEIATGRAVSREPVIYGVTYTSTT